jgi:hypothetical protein
MIVRQVAEEAQRRPPRVAGTTPAKARYDLIAKQWLLPPI